MKTEEELRSMTERQQRHILNCLRGMGGQHASRVKPQVDLITKLLEEGSFIKGGEKPAVKRKAPPRGDSTTFEIWVATKFVAKAQNAAERGLEFSLSLMDMRRLLRRKTCAYTGITFEPNGRNKRTLERVDSTKGYIKGNVVAVCSFANDLKNSLMEDPTSKFFMEPKQLRKFIKATLC